MALRKIGTSRDVAAFTLTGDSGWRTSTGKSQTWVTAGETAVTLEPGTYLIEGPPSAAQYNRSPWTSDGNVTTPAPCIFEGSTARRGGRGKSPD